MSKTAAKYQRIVSLAASLTETLFAFGAGARVVGVTDTCDYPHEVREKPHVSCWFEPDMEKLLSLKPDLVLGLQMAHSGLRPELEKRGIPMILVNPATVEESLEDMAMLGERLQAADEAQACVENLRDRLARLDSRVAKIPLSERPTVSRVLEVENNMFIVAGPLSFQYDVIARAGGRNVTGEIHEAYPKVTFDQFKRWDPDVIFFCGYDRGFVPRFCTHEAYRSLKAAQTRRVYQFDCGLTCRTGPRIVEMGELLFRTLYEEELGSGLVS